MIAILHLHNPREHKLKNSFKWTVIKKKMKTYSIIQSISHLIDLILNREEKKLQPQQEVNKCQTEAYQNSTKTMVLGVKLTYRSSMEEGIETSIKASTELVEIQNRSKWMIIHKERRLENLLGISQRRMINKSRYPRLTL